MSHFVLVLFAFVCLMSTATASLSPLSQTIESCETLLYPGLTHCFDYLGYLGKGTRMHEHPSSSCCSVLRDAWKVDPECVNFNVLDGFIRVRYWDFDRDTRRLDHLSSTCGIGSLKSNPRKFVFLT
ncbi:hypothetical protein CTI12_AA412390 [Artemisia annua]|uniref:Bifunctional inhibitor/plant lipid transfer protein/seed storage helical domain-containing protein n=1 Tax=Artemisia annua TaxID=35608 RepID=A0A2U1M965_ARTAN|nr:hypothetical protein CTI12_AA412390 [Artemisia annua]